MEQNSRQGVIRFGISLPESLLAQFDENNRERGYANRSEAVRDLIRERMVQKEWEKGEGETAGAVVLIYDHHKRGLGDKLTHTQHHHHDAIISTMHAHLDHDNCMEVILLRGRAQDIQSIANQLISTKHVKMGQFVPATLGGELK